MSDGRIQPISGRGGGYEVLESYYASKIDRLEAEEALSRDKRFASVAASLFGSPAKAPEQEPLPYVDRLDLKQPFASPELETSALNKLRSGAELV
jgi:hypothetical protein